MMPDSGAETYGETFDDHHVHVVAVNPKLRPFFNFNPGFEHDARVKVDFSNLSCNLHIVGF